MKTIKIKVNRDGSEVQVGVEGVKGESCTDLTSQLEQAMLAGDSKEREFTSEYFESNPLFNSEEA